MTPEQYEHITQIIKDTIQEKVNGKIDKMKASLDAYIEKDDEWKEQALPTIKLGNNILGFGKTFAWILVTITGIAAIYKYFK